MTLKSIYVPAELHRELKLWAVASGKTLSETVRQFLTEGLQRARERSATLAEQEHLLVEGYQMMAEEHARLAEESVHYAVEVLDPDEEWPEYQLEVAQGDRPTLAAAQAGRRSGRQERMTSNDARASSIVNSNTTGPAKPAASSRSRNRSRGKSPAPSGR